MTKLRALFQYINLKKKKKKFKKREAILFIIEMCISSMKMTIEWGEIISIFH